MKYLSQPAKTIAAILVGIALSGAAIAADPTGLRPGAISGPSPATPGQPAASTTVTDPSGSYRPPGTRSGPSPANPGQPNASGVVTDKSGTFQAPGALSGPAPTGTSGRQAYTTAYNDSMKTIKSDYKAANAKCSQMAAADRRACTKEAKATRSAETKRAKETRSAAMTSGRTGAAGMGAR